MPPIHEIQAHLITSIHDPTYKPIRPPTKTSVSKIPRWKKERLELYGDTLLRFRLTSLLFHEFPERGPDFISSINGALLSNHTFTNILNKADGHSDPNGFPVKKHVADEFETAAAHSYFQLGYIKFEAWFLDTFIPLVGQAASLWDRTSNSGCLQDEDETHPRTEETHIDYFTTAVSQPSAHCLQAVPQTSCIKLSMEEADTRVDKRPFPPPLCTVEIPRRRRRQEETPEEQPLPKRRWTEAMEAAGNQNTLPQSRWVDAMMRNNSEPNAARKQGVNKSRYGQGASLSYVVRRPLPSPVSAKENCPPPPTTTEPPRRKSRWDVRCQIPKMVERQDSLTSPPTFHEVDTLLIPTRKPLEPTRSSPLVLACATDPVPRLATIEPQGVIRPPAAVGPSDPIHGIETSTERELSEPLHVEPSAFASLAQLPRIDTHSTIRVLYHNGERATGSCSPMLMSPDLSPTKTILPQSPRRDDGLIANPAIGDAAPLAPSMCRPTADCEAMALDMCAIARRRRSDSLSSTSSSHMDISPCSSPTKFLFGQGLETPTDILCSPRPRVNTGGSDPGTSRETCALASSHPKQLSVTQNSIFWPGKTVVFTYKQQPKIAPPVVRLD
ncbi:hypothetical protein B0H11DRAFT_2215882 [Mycena galericulata]|nr:hypothetical protein B0H11DRAFT_2215882 [Mycena galericulata]